MESKFINFIKQIFCNHDYEPIIIDDYKWPSCEKQIQYLYCKKCGKLKKYE